MDLVICIIYIVTGGIWICKNIKLDSIVSPTNWRIMFIKLLMLFMIPLALYIFFYFSMNNKLRVFLGISVLLVNEILSYFLLLEIKKNIIRYCKSEMKEDVIEKLRKKELRFYLGMTCSGTIIFMGVLIYFLPI